MRIAVCEDILILAEELSKIIVESGVNGHDVKIFTNGKDLLEEIENIDLVFLDVGMPEMDGIEVGREIRKRDLPCHIVMATAYDYFKEAFEIHALRYIKKPYQKEKIKEAIEEASKIKPPKRIHSKPIYKPIRAFQKRLVYLIPQEDISFVKSFNGYVKIHTDSGCFRKESSLVSCMDELEKTLFVRINRSTIVGLSHIIKEEGGNVFLKKNRISLTRTFRKSFRETYYEFMKKNTYI